METTPPQPHSRRRFSPAWPVKDLPAGSSVLIQGLSDDGPNGPEAAGAPDADPKPKAVWRFYVSVSYTHLTLPTKA